MIKKIICWLFGHKKYGWIYIPTKKEYNDPKNKWFHLEGQMGNLDKCPRCGSNLA